MTHARLSPTGRPTCSCGTKENWRVTQRQCNHSAFNGYRWAPSRYSEVICSRALGGCGARWRTKAKYVEMLPDGE